MSQLLNSKISAVRGKHVSVALGSALGAMVLALVVCLATGMLLDWWLDLPRWIRTAFLGVDGALLITILVRVAILPVLFGPDDDQIALRVEDAEPSFATRLIASIQLSRPGAVTVGASTSMVRQMVLQAEAIANRTNFGRVVKSDRMFKLVVAAAIVVLLGSVAFVRGRSGGVSTDLLKRAFLSNVPVPRKTRIAVLSRQFTLATRTQSALVSAVPPGVLTASTADDAGDMTVARGETVVLGAKALGIIPTGDSRNIVDVRFDTQRKLQFPLDPVPNDPTLFVSSEQNVQESFSYRINLGDSTTRWYRVTTLAPPAVTKIECQQLYPAYTRIGAVTRSLGDLSILAGSRLLLKVNSSNPVSPNTKEQPLLNSVHLVGSEQSVPLNVDPADPTLLTVDVPIPDKTTGFSVLLTDSNGLRSKDPAVYRVDLVPDKEPTVTVTYPEQKEVLATRVAKVDIGFDAVDDYGITQLLLKYKVDDGAELSIPLKVGAEHPKHMKNYYEWSMGRIATTATTRPSLEGANVEYWLEALDNNDITGPGKGVSEHFSIRIVTESEKKAEMSARIGSSIESLKGAAADQKELRKKLGDLIIESKPDQP